MVYRPHYLDKKVEFVEYFGNGALVYKVADKESQPFRRKEKDEVVKFYGRRKRRFNNGKTKEIKSRWN